jgi:hypothetical protein
MIDFDDLSLKSDNIHFTGNTHQELGYRFAEAILPWIPSLRLLGDMNWDNNVDSDDIDDFVLGLNDAAAYESKFGIPPSARGDMDGDGDHDFDDIRGFVAATLVNGQAGVQSIPEPGSALLAGMALVLVLACQARPVPTDRWQRALCSEVPGPFRPAGPAAG